MVFENDQETRAERWLGVDGTPLKFYEGETQHFLRDPDERTSRLIYRGELAPVKR